MKVLIGLAVGWALLLPASGFGGVVDAATRLAQDRDAVEEAYSTVPIYRTESGALVDYANVTSSGSECGSHKPLTFGVLIGVNHAIANKKLDLKGAENDVELISTAFRERLHSDVEITALKGSGATRASVRSAFLEVMAKVNCGDRVAFFFAGHSTFFGFQNNLVLRGRAKAIPPGDPSYDHAQAILHTLDTRALFLLWSDNESFDTISALDIGEFVTNVRNRHADIIVVLDGSHAAAAAILDQQRQADSVVGWSEPMTNDFRGTRLLPSRGDFAAYYSSPDGKTSAERSFPMPNGTSVVHGDFSFAFAEALQDSPALTARGLADRLKKKGGDASERNYNSEGSNPNMLLFDRQPTLDATASAIFITSPEQTRGPAAVKSAAIDITGTVNWNSAVGAVLINGEPAELTRTGGFSHTVNLVTGVNTVKIVALTQENLLLQKSLDIVYAGDIDALKGSGRNYAVIIANADYKSETGLSPLQTPIADADAIEDELVRHFGFVAQAKLPNGSTADLSLRNATGRDIEMALYNVSQVAGANDTVLIYYAGHGIYEPMTTTAFWVPIDAVAGLPPTYLSASTISEAIDRIQARKVVLISDSCFSGALMRGGTAANEEIDSKARVNSLLALARSKSRLLISSGNNEPVSDAGGNGHSVFAQALLNGLANEVYDEFSARELFDSYILNTVTANAKQEPQFRPLENVGHEGGDVIFVRSPGQ